tara:strand:+ start:1646 stop:2398 length:753 start_codon:yes stop_codon:yes gene_type:complete
MLKKNKKNRKGKNKYNDVIFEDMEIYSETRFETNNKFKKSHSYSIPKNISQKTYLDHLKNETVKIIIASGPAGTGKTMFACEQGIKRLLNGEIEKLIITRPAIAADEEIGYLPGTLEDKMEPWVRPIYDVLYNFISPSYLKDLLKEHVIEIVPLAYMRGRTFKDSWIIADEMQNATISQTKMLLTRIGNNSKMILTGDLEQHDRKNDDSGLSDFISKIQKYTGNSIKHIAFQIKDIEREAVVKDILKLYN